MNMWPGSKQCVWCALCAILLLSPAYGETSSLELRYRVRITGVDDRALRDDLESVSDAIALIKRPPVSETQLRRRAARDVPRFLQVLRSYGYYAASVDVSIRVDRKPARVRYIVDVGPPYMLRDVRMVALTEEPDAGPAPMPEGVALAQQILQAEDRIVQFLERKGYPFARVLEREVRVVHSARAVDVLYLYDAGPRATFGDTTFLGLSSVREPFVREKIPWNPGDPYDGDLLRLAQRRLAGSDLFSTVRITKGDALTPESELPMRVELSERKHRSIGFGVGYASDEGMRGRVTWEHRNLLHEGERLTLSWAISEIGYASEARFQKPDFRRVDQVLKISLRAALDEPDAFRSRNVGALVGVDRELRPGLVVGAGTGFRYVSVRDAEEENRFGLLYFPAHVDWDRSDDLLDPRRGGRLAFSVAPYHDVTGNEVTFGKVRVAATRYMSVTRRPALDFAVRFVLASIGGAARDDIPADERYYAGGGGTVRGYEYQSVGPLEGKTPLGGKSLALSSFELRWRFANEFGLVAFADGGAAYEESVPDSTEEYLWGAGFGIRYYTPVGPLRFDLAFPLDRRSGVDDSFQFYISLGQAF